MATGAEKHTTHYTHAPQWRSQGNIDSRARNGGGGGGGGGGGVEGEEAISVSMV